MAELTGGVTGGLNGWPLFAAAFLVLLAGLLFLAIARLLRRSSGMPGGEIIYADHGSREKPEKPLYDASLGLTGKPDYLVRRKDLVIPLEVKSMWAPFTPYDSHVMQLGAYCILVEKQFNARPPYGLLRYRNRTFRVPFTPELEEAVIGHIERIRGLKEKEGAARSHDQPNRCARCGYRHVCDQRI
jgi:CRISPR-associated exonuclease Cas4